MPGSPMDSEIAAALMAAHLSEFFTHSPQVASSPDDWCWHLCDSELQAVIGIPARLEADQVVRRIYHVLIDATYYDVAPMKIRFVAPCVTPAEHPESGSAAAAVSGASPLLGRRGSGGPAARKLAAGCTAPTARGWVRSRAGTPTYPWIAGSPGAQSGPQVPIQFALHDSYGYANGVTDQLVCFSYSYDYYEGHSPSEGQAWRSGRDRVDATINRLYEVLNCPSYLGPSAQEAT